MKQLAQGSTLLALCSWLLSSACSLAVDTAELERGCAQGSKPCEVEPGIERCVSVTDPEYGCARESCVPCTLAHAVEVCDLAGECAVGTCQPSYQNCDLVAKNGCEVNLDSNYDNCGNCDSSCADDLRDMPHTQSAQCESQRCVVETCKEGFADCDGAATNGCEHALEAADCGRCDGCPTPKQCNLVTQRCE